MTTHKKSKTAKKVTKPVTKVTAKMTKDSINSMPILKSWFLATEKPKAKKRK